jgi:hypothetical protein
MKMYLRSGIDCIELINCPPSRWLHLDICVVLLRYTDTFYHTALTDPTDPVQ